MQAVAGFILLQIFTLTLLLNFSSSTPLMQNTKHSPKHVLGLSILADDTTPVDQPTDTPAADIPTDTPVPDTSANTTSNNSVTPVDTISPTGDNSSVEPTSVPAPTEAPISDTPSPTSDTSGSDQPTPLPTDVSGGNASSDTNPILNQDDVIATPESINPDIVSQAEAEDKKVDETTGPQKTELLTHFSEGVVQSISDNLKAEDFSTTSYLVQRLLSNVNQTQTIISTTGNFRDKQKLTSFCKQADLDLKAQQLQVPENLEQDIEIVRGDCLTTQ
ncbi:MAG TPA: hypothetical protein VFQ63_04020 [Patescibacteria group bacterium]|nr:hypothetical protein [Patescibacteria group bacterium]